MSVAGDQNKEGNRRTEPYPRRLRAQVPLIRRPDLLSLSAAHSYVSIWERALVGNESGPTCFVFSSSSTAISR
jgi:hypothetical protein